MWSILKRDLGDFVSTVTGDTKEVLTTVITNATVRPGPGVVIHLIAAPGVSQMGMRTALLTSQVEALSPEACFESYPKQCISCCSP
jgi:hypothetical protein